jgi:metal-responsive CopG/Arc/MetJ family transcriptional regulator
MSTMISVRCEDRLLRDLDRACKGRALTRASAVKQAIELWLADLRIRDAVRRHRQGYSRRPVTPDEFGPVPGAQRWPR